MSTPDPRLSGGMSRRTLSHGALAMLAAAAWPLSDAGAQTLHPGTLNGTWSGQERGPLGTMALGVIFLADGTYRRQHRLGDLLTFDTGTYQVVQHWIHFRLEDYGPRMYRGRPLTRPRSDTWAVSRFDGRLLRATVGGNSQVSIERR